MTELESWAENAARELRALVADAEQSAPGQHVCLELRALLAEYDDIRAGRPTWRSRLVAGAAGERAELPAFLLGD